MGAVWEEGSGCRDRGR